MTNRLYIAVLAGGMLAGCGGGGDEAAPVAAPAAAAPAGATVGPALVAPEAPPVAPPGGTAPAALTPAAPAGPAESAPLDATAQERILAAMQSYVIDNSANPKSLEELVTRGYLKSLPAAPAGKKWVYNPEKLAIELADK